MSARGVAIFAVLIAVLGGCGRPAPSGSAGVRDCRVPGATPRLERALCEADINGVAAAQHEPTTISSVDDIARRQQSIMRTLARVFVGDRSVGDGLPWDRWQTPSFQLALVTSLAPHVRGGGDAGVTLEALQRFATTFAAQDTSVGRAQSALLLGATDHPEAYDELARRLNDAEGAHERQLTITALAQLCDARVAELLTQLASGPDVRESSLAEVRRSSWNRYVVPQCRVMRGSS